VQELGIHMSRDEIPGPVDCHELARRAEVFCRGRQPPVVAREAHEPRRGERGIRVAHFRPSGSTGRKRSFSGGLRPRQNTFALRAGLSCVLVVLTLAGCGNWGPPQTQVVVPTLQLGKATLKGVLRTYGPPRVATAEDDLWYVGPGQQSLTHGNDGWMTLLSFDGMGILQTQEYLHRGMEQNYLQVDYWIHRWLESSAPSPAVRRPVHPKSPGRGKPVGPVRLGGDPFADRDRDLDFDQLMIARCVELAQADPDYQVTTNQPDMFVLARVLPSENDPVVQFQVKQFGDRVELTMRVRALPGRDEPLMAQIDAIVGKRMLLIEVPQDAQTPVTEHEPMTPR